MGVWVFVSCLAMFVCVNGTTHERWRRRQRRPSHQTPLTRTPLLSVAPKPQLVKWAAGDGHSTTAKALERERGFATLALARCLDLRSVNALAALMQEGGQACGGVGVEMEEGDGGGKEAEANTRLLAGLGGLDVALDRQRWVGSVVVHGWMDG